MKVASMSQINKLVELWQEKFPNEHYRKMDEAFREHLSSRPKLLEAFDSLCEEVPEVNRRRRILVGKVTLDYSCIHCGAEHRGLPRKDCPCVLEAQKTVSHPSSPWKFLGVAGRKLDGRTGSWFLQCRHCKVKVKKGLSGFIKPKGSRHPFAICGCVASVLTARQPLEHAKYVERIKETGMKIKLLSEYKGMNRKIRYRCLVHDLEREAWAGNLVKGKGCPKCGLDKQRKTNLAKYGVEWSLQHPDARKKRRTTMLQRYGAEHALQNTKLFNKMVQSSYKRIEYKVGKKALTVQGYEGLALDAILANTSIEFKDIQSGTRTPIRYTWKGKERVYYPDFYVPPKNLIIEVKSTYTYSRFKNLVLKKRAACLEAGYRFILLVMNKDGTRNHDYAADYS